MRRETYDLTNLSTEPVVLGLETVCFTPVFPKPFYFHTDHLNFRKTRKTIFVFATQEYTTKTIEKRQKYLGPRTTGRETLFYTDRVETENVSPRYVRSRKRTYGRSGGGKSKSEIKKQKTKKLDSGPNTNARNAVRAIRRRRGRRSRPPRGLSRFIDLR